MVAEERPVSLTGDPVAQLALLLEEWRLRPVRNSRWLAELCLTFAKREPAACARYDRVATLGAGIASLLDLPPLSRAVVRGSALLSALARVPTAPETGRGKRNVTRLWENKLREWRWVQMSASVLYGLLPGYDARQPLARHRKEAPAEGRILALAEDFVDFTHDSSGAPRARIPQVLNALRSGRGHSHDSKLVDLLWSEEGQSVLDRVLRRRALSPDELAVELKASVRLLDKAPPPPQLAPRRRDLEVALAEKVAPAARAHVEAAAPAEKVASAAPVSEEAAEPEEHVERGEEMKTTTAKDVWSIESHAGAPSASEPPPSLAGRLAAAMSGLEEIKAAATRSQEALAAVLPAMEELSQVVARLQASLLHVQDGPDPLVAREAPGPRPVVLRVELPDGALSGEELAEALSGLPDLEDVRVRDQGASGLVVKAKASAASDLALLEAKVSGALVRYLGDAGADESVNVTVLEAD